MITIFKSTAFTGVALLLVLVQASYASPQDPDLFIVRGDTVEIYHLPLRDFLEKDTTNYYWRMIRHDKMMFSFNNWRGYQAVWTLENGKLWLTDLILPVPDPLGLSNQEVWDRMFAGHLEDGRVLATWFSSKLVVPLGPTLRWDGVFYRTFTQETIFSFDRGILVDSHTVYNYIPIPGRERRLNYDDINRLFLPYIQALDWEYLQRLDCDVDYEITISKTGAVATVRHQWEPEVSFWHEPREWMGIRHCSRAIKQALGQIRFDIVKWHGVPIQEIIYIQLYYDPHAGILYDEAIYEFDDDLDDSDE